ncbi:stealth conserved region 3 domain-containing protein [Kitasatospora phosalacinea]|uniref:Stealth conserved region 3 domain-containing protein n=1 Tax=Kitasatospora phosalacinea TaxID=2065 RepID=A0ABW6GQG6_9ACTN
MLGAVIPGAPAQPRAAGAWDLPGRSWLGPQWSWHPDRPRTAHTKPELTPLEGREANHRAVTALLDAAGVEHFTVPGVDDRSSVVGVPEPRRAAALAALAAGMDGSGAFATAVRPGRPLERPLRPADRADWDRFADTPVLQVSWPLLDPTGTLALGHEYGCAVEFWTPDGGLLRAPRANRIAGRVAADGPPVELPAHLFTRLLSAHGTDPVNHRTVRSRAEFDRTGIDAITFPVDLVYTWVDGTDPAWQRRKAEASGAVYHSESASDARFLSRDELRYSLRSLRLNAPWVRNVYVVTDDQRPDWLDEDAPGLRVVDHREIFADPANLPTFNSHAIESQLHRIEGLAEHFLYLNDDMFIGRPLSPHAFFTPTGIAKHFPSAARIPLGPVSAEDTPVDAACKNNRVLLEECFGRVNSQPMDHIPYALLRSVMTEMSERFPAEWARTAASRFRAMTDLSVTSSLHHYYALFTGRSVPSSLQYGYVQLAHPELAQRLARMLARRDRDAICVNDAFSVPEDMAAQNAVLEPWLEAYFPTRNRYERGPR